MTVEEQAAQAADEAAQAAQAAQEAEAQAQAAAAAAATAKPEDVAALRAQLADVRKEAAKYRTRAKELEDARRKAEEAALAEQGKHKELAEQRQKELEALQPELEQLRSFKAQREQQEAAVREARRAQVDAEFNVLPEPVREGISADADLTVKEAVIRAYRAASGTRAPHLAPTAPRPASGSTQAPPEPTTREYMALGNPRTPLKERAEIQAKHDAFMAWREANS